MDNEDIQNTVQLPEEMVVYIGQFLDGDDLMNWSLAYHGVRTASPSIYWKKIRKRKNPKSISISQCYYLKPDKWMIELQYNSVRAGNLTAFDASHCLWFPVEALLETLSSMPNLEQLLVHGTKISLAHLPMIFKVCQKVNKLSVTLTEKNLDEFTESKMKEDFGWLLKGFQRLTHLKLFTFNLSNENCCASWPVTLGVLGCCSSRCINLHIEVGYPPAYFSEERPFLFDMRQSCIGEQHSWMYGLKSLVFIARGGGPLPRDNFVHHLLERFASRREPNSFQRLWVEQQSMFVLNTLDWYNDIPLTNSLVLWPDDREHFLNDYVGLHPLEHVGDVSFSRLANKPAIKYIRGYCTDAEGLNEFCEEHPLLEHLHFSTVNEDDYYTFDDRVIVSVGKWSLPHLKTLVYRCSCPVKEIVDHLIISCPNSEALHIGRIDDSVDPSAYPIVDDNVLSVIKFPELTSLSLNGFQLSDGSYLDSIVKQCPRLKSLHLGGAVQPGEFLRKLGDCLPKATNLRDLRIQLFNREEVAVVLEFLNKLRACSSHLKRLVFHIEDLCDFANPTAAAELRTFLTSFPLEMQCLELLYIAGTGFDENDPEVDLYWKNRLSPVRPGFGFYLGSNLPYGNDPDAPRNHFDEIVRPIDWFRAPPRFDDYIS